MSSSKLMFPLGSKFGQADCKENLIEIGWEIWARIILTQILELCTKENFFQNFNQNYFICSNIMQDSAFCVGAFDYSVTLLLSLEY